MFSKKPQLAIRQNNGGKMRFSKSSRQKGISIWEKDKVLHHEMRWAYSQTWTCCDFQTLPQGCEDASRKAQNGCCPWGRTTTTARFYSKPLQRSTTYHQTALFCQLPGLGIAFAKDCAQFNGCFGFSKMTRQICLSSTIPLRSQTMIVQHGAPPLSGIVDMRFVKARSWQSAQVCQG